MNVNVNVTLHVNINKVEFFQRHKSIRKISVVTPLFLINVNIANA